MALKDYSKVYPRGNYGGIRVTGKHNGEQIQRYFVQARAAEAHALEAEIVEQRKHRGVGVAQPRSQQYNYSAPRYDPPRRTKVVGMTIGFNKQRKCNPPHFYPCVNIAHQDKTRNISAVTGRTITESRNLQNTWRECCRILAMWRGYKRVPKGWYAQCPPVEQYEELRRWYCENGTEIAESNVEILTTGVRA